MTFLLWVFCLSSIMKRPVKHKQGLQSICASNQKLFPRHHVSHSVENQIELFVLTQAKTGKKRSLSTLLQMDAHRTHCNITDLPKHINTYIKHSTTVFLGPVISGSSLNESFNMLKTMDQSDLSRSRIIISRAPGVYMLNPIDLMLL